MYSLCNEIFPVGLIVIRTIFKLRKDIGVGLWFQKMAIFPLSDNELEIKTFGLGYAIGDVFSEIALCVTSSNGGHWDVHLRVYIKSEVGG